MAMETPAEGATPPGTGIRPRRPRVAILLSFLLCFLILLVVFREVLFPFLMAIFIAYLIEPLVAAVTKAPVFGVRWTRGPTIIVMYVVLLGGVVLASSYAVAKVSAGLRDFTQTVQGHLDEHAERATFHIGPAPGAEPVEGAAATTPYDRDVRIPAGTLVEIRPHAKGGAREDRTRTTQPEVFATLYDVVLKAGKTEAPPVLLRKAGLEQRPDETAVGTILSPDDVRFADGQKVPDAERIHVHSPEPAVGLEVLLEKTLITPIVQNLAKVGFQVEPITVREIVSAQAKGLGEGVPQKITGWTRTAITRLALGIYQFILILMLTAFLVLDRKRIARFFGSLPPPAYADEYATLIRYVDRGLAGVIRGQLVICAVNGLLTYVGLLLLGVKGPALLGLLAGILSLIPIFGTILSSVPIVLIAATDSIEKGIFALAWIVFIHLLEANLLNPLIMGSHAQMHPVIIVFALLAGEHYFGVWGALLAVPTMSIIQSCFQFYRYEIEGVPRVQEPAHGEWLRSLFRKLLRKRATRSEGA
jgi:predicted PurR-regulated permease PerM